MCNKLDLNKAVVNKACEIFKKVEEDKQQNKKLKRNPECVIAGCVYIACLMKDVPRTFKEFGRGVTSEQVTKSEMGERRPPPRAGRERMDSSGGRCAYMSMPTLR